MPEKTAQKLEFVGPPNRLAAVGGIPRLYDQPEISGPIAKLLIPDRQALRVRRGGRRTQGLSLRLAPQTPPGDYKGVITEGKTRTPFVARVLANTKLSILAGELGFFGTPGKVAATTLAFANNGNTDIVLPRAIPVALFDDDGIETAFAESYARARPTLDDFFAAFHGKLRAAHTGVLKLAISRGYGVHTPGTSFSADFKLSISSSLKPGHRFHGIASTDYFELPISLSVTNGAS